jgi:hypothetical protein
VADDRRTGRTRKVSYLRTNPRLSDGRATPRLHEAIPAEVGIVNDFDFAIFKLHKHPAFPNGFPKLETADYADLHEMMEVATCGYPFGDFLWNQVGSVTSSFTKGTMSAILPAPGIAR